MLVWLLFSIRDVQARHALGSRVLVVLEILHQAVVFLYLKWVNGVEKPVVSVSSRGKSTWTAALVGEHRSSSRAGDTYTLMPPPQVGIRPDPKPIHRHLDVHVRNRVCPHARSGEVAMTEGHVRQRTGAQPTLLPCHLTAGLASLLGLLIHFGSRSPLLRIRGVQSQLCDSGGKKASLSARF